MAGNQLGVWHQTSEQAVRQQQQRLSTTTTTLATFASASSVAVAAAPAADRKRKHELDRREPQQRPTKRTTGMPALPARPPPLAASTIADVLAQPEKDGQGTAGPAAAKDDHPAWLARDGPSEYSQRRVFNATPTPAVDPLLSLDHPRYGLPRTLVANLAALGIRSIYPWQKQCLLGGGGRLLDGARNLVYAAPTGGGKSLVADVLMLRQVLGETDDHGASMEDTQAGYGDGSRRRRHRKRPKALLVLPFVALVQEKVRWLRRLVGDASSQVDSQSQRSLSQPRPLPLGDDNPVRVVGFFGGAKIRATWADFDIGVATIEKANSLINTAIDDCSIADLRVVVLDELHMVDDAHRGYLLELLATKLLCLDHPVQIIGMSATLPNMDLLARWLNAYSYETRYRPIPIEEHIVYDGRVYATDVAAAPQNAEETTGAPADTPSLSSQLRPVRAISASEHRELQDSVTNAVVALANEIARAGYGALVFASSRAASESDALLISRVLPASAAELGDDVWDARVDLLAELQSCLVNSGGGTLDTKLSQTVLAGVGFHHAGMTAEERDLVASAYDTGVLKVCVATCGLAAGINLPARRVILHNARMGRDLVGPAMLRQMRGRAGRKGKDELGETYLCCYGRDVDDVLDRMHAELPHVASCLLDGHEEADTNAAGAGKSTGVSAGAGSDAKDPGVSPDAHRLQRALLEAITVRLATGRASVDDYVRKTMLYHTVVGAGAESDGGGGRGSGIWAGVVESLVALRAKGLIETGDDEDANSASASFRPTRLGKAVVAAALDPQDALFLHGELQRALQAFVLDGEMHVLYTFTPVHSMSGALDWRRYWEEMEGLDDSGMRVLRFLGLKPSVIMQMAKGSTLKETTAAEKATARVYRRFYLALQLRDLCNEMPVHRVAQKYGTPRGAVQTLAQTCEGFAAGMIKFCEHMGWGAMSSVLEHFVDRLKAGAKTDLLALAKIAFVKSRTARVFWENGFKTVAAVANADPSELLPVLLQAQAGKIRLDEGDGRQQRLGEKLLAKARIITESANRIWQLEMQRELDEEWTQ